MATTPAPTPSPAPAPAPRKGLGVGKTIAIGLVVLIAVLVGFIATRPAEFRVERTAQLNAPADVIFPLIDNLHNWPAWSPYEKLDPEMKKTFEGPEAGAGASYGWDGNSQAGAGMKLAFTRPFESACQIKFRLVPDSGGTKVTWSMVGENNFIGKAMCLVMDMDQMIGKDFEEGLASLSKVAQEKTPAGN